MTLAARGTSHRRILDLLCAKPVTRRQEINRALNDIARPAIIKILDSEITKGYVAQTEEGYSLTEAAIELYRYESTRRSYETKPLDRKYMMQTEGRRDGCQDFKSWESKHV